MSYPDLFLFIEHYVGFSRPEGLNSINLYVFHILFYQAANTTNKKYITIKYIEKSNFLSPEILALKILKSKQMRPHMYAALRHVSTEYFTDLQ